MKIKLIAVGDLQQAHLKEGTLLFEKRLQHYIPYSTDIIKPPRAAKSARPDQSVKLEAELIFQKLEGVDYCIVLDERGKTMGSEVFAEQLRKLMIASTRSVAFVIGGSYGLDESVRNKANLVLSLSPMTFTHEMARFFLTEQIYRAMSILKNEKYHH